MSNTVEKLRKIRKFEEISRAELAEKAGISVHTVAKYEAGNMNPTIELIEKVLRAIGYTIEIVKKRGG